MHWVMYGQDELLKFRQNIKMGKKGDLSEVAWLLVSDGRDWIWYKQHEIVDPSYLNSSHCCRWCDGVGDIFSVCFEHCLHATAYLSIVANHVHPFMTTLHHLPMATSCETTQHVAKLRPSPTMFLEPHTEFIVLRWPPRSPELNPTEHSRDAVKQEIHIMDDESAAPAWCDWTFPQPCWICATEN